jgi:flagellar protein FlaG
MDIGSVRPNDLPLSVIKPVDTPLRKQERREIIQAVKAIGKTDMPGEDNELTFVVDRDTRKVLVRIVNKETREVVRQIPSEIVLRLARELDQK